MSHYDAADDPGSDLSLVVEQDGASMHLYVCRRGDGSKLQILSVLDVTRLAAGIPPEALTLRWQGGIGYLAGPGGVIAVCDASGQLTVATH